ncbi:MAG: hypothetical protein BroJett031_01970 [Betaproteobacteria bacterium]|nr:MAG: hypothetical protein BroJett031_01970 [Betaproteobacteria bacterium]
MVSRRSSGTVGAADSRTLAAADLPGWLAAVSGGAVVALHIQPGARRSAVVGVHAGRLKLALQAPPVEGRANEALVAYLAAVLRIPRRQVLLVAGKHSRAKRVELRGVDPAGVARALAPSGDGE